MFYCVLISREKNRAELRDKSLGSLRSYFLSITRNRFLSQNCNILYRSLEPIFCGNQFQSSLHTHTRHRRKMFCHFSWIFMTTSLRSIVLKFFFIVRLCTYCRKKITFDNIQNNTYPPPVSRVD